MRSVAPWLLLGTIAVSQIFVYPNASTDHLVWGSVLLLVLTREVIRAGRERCGSIGVGVVADRSVVRRSLPASTWCVMKRQPMRYVETPGRYDPCAQYKPGESIWASHA